MPLLDDSCNSCIGRSLCFWTKKVRPKYKEHCRAIFPQGSQPMHIPLNIGALIGYANANTDLIREIARYLAKLLHRDLFEGNYGHVECALMAFMAMLEEFRSPNVMALYESYLIDVIGELIEQHNVDLKLLGLRAVCKCNIY